MNIKRTCWNAYELIMTVQPTSPTTFYCLTFQFYWIYSYMCGLVASFYNHFLIIFNYISHLFPSFPFLLVVTLVTLRAELVRWDGSWIGFDRKRGKCVSFSSSPIISYFTLNATPSLLWDSLFSFPDPLHLLPIRLGQQSDLVCRNPHWIVRHLFPFNQNSASFFNKITHKKNVPALIRKGGGIWTHLRLVAPKFPSLPSWGRPQIRGIFCRLHTLLNSTGS